MQVFETAGSPVDVADCDPRQPPGHRRAGQGVRRDIVENGRGGVRIGEAIVQLLGLDAPVERRHDDTGELTGPMQARHFEPVLQDDSETVTAPEAERRQPTGNARDFLIPGRIAEPPLAVDDRGHLGAAFDRSKKGPAQIKHWESITSRRWAQASGRFRLRATPAGISDPVVQKPRQAPAHTLIGAAAPLSGGHAGPSGIASDLCRHHRGCGGHGRGWVLRRMKPSVHSGTWLA